jgi:hypothetical protein
MTKEKNVAFISESLKKEFEKLKNGKYEEGALYDYIDRAIDDLKKDPCVGIKLPKKLWPREYIIKYGVTNLWKYDLPNAWRLNQKCRNLHNSLCEMNASY